MGQIDSGANAEKQFLQCPSKFGCLWHQQSNLSAFPEKIFRAICDAICFCWLGLSNKDGHITHTAVLEIYETGLGEAKNSHGESPCSLASLAWNGQLLPERPLFFREKQLEIKLVRKRSHCSHWFFTAWDLIIRYYNLYHLVYSYIVFNIRV